MNRKEFPPSQISVAIILSLIIDLQHLCPKELNAFVTWKGMKHSSFYHQKLYHYHCSYTKYTFVLNKIQHGIG